MESFQVVCQSLGTSWVYQWKESQKFLQDFSSLKYLNYNIILLSLHKIAHCQPLLSSQSLSSHFQICECLFRGTLWFPLCSPLAIPQYFWHQMSGNLPQSKQFSGSLQTPTECSTFQLTVNWTQCRKHQKICSLVE